MFAELMSVAGVKPDNLKTLGYLVRALSKGKVDSLLLARSRDAMRGLQSEVLDLRLDRERLDFFIEREMTWRAGKAPGDSSRGLLHYWECGRRFEVVAATMREAIDIARTDAQEREKSGYWQQQ